MEKLDDSEQQSQIWKQTETAHQNSNNNSWSFFDYLIFAWNTFEKRIIDHREKFFYCYYWNMHVFVLFVSIRWKQLQIDIVLSNNLTTCKDLQSLIAIIFSSKSDDTGQIQLDLVKETIKSMHKDIYILISSSNNTLHSRSPYNQLWSSTEMFFLYTPKPLATN